MGMLKNFTIRTVMLTILGLFSLLWSGIGLFSIHSLNSLSDGNDVDRHIVEQMTALSQGNDQYFRMYYAFVACDGEKGRRCRPG